MSAPVKHKQIYRHGPFGGTLNRTLCGRVSNASDDGMNIAENGDDGVTCKLCRKLMARASFSNVSALARELNGGEQ